MLLVKAKHAYFGQAYGVEVVLSPGRSTICFRGSCATNVEYLSYFLGDQKSWFCSILIGLEAQRKTHGVTTGH